MVKALSRLLQFKRNEYFDHAFEWSVNTTGTNELIKKWSLGMKGV